MHIKAIETDSQPSTKRGQERRGRSHLANPKKATVTTKKPHRPSELAGGAHSYAVSQP